MQKRIQIDIDSEKIAAVLHNEQNDEDACVITCHGLLASKDSPKYILLADKLSKIGLSVLRFDFRGCGESEGRLEYSYISNRLKDLKAVVDYASKDLGIKRIGLFGSSMGGFVSYLMVSRNQLVKTLISLASPISMAELFDAVHLNDGKYEIDGILFGKPFISDIKQNGTLSNETLEKIKCPVYIFHGDWDGLVPVGHAYRIFDRIKSEKKLRIINGGDHIFSNPTHLTEIIENSSFWFQKYLME